MSKFFLSEVLGNSQKLDGGSMFGNVPRSVWETWIKSDHLGRIDLECRAMLIEIDNKRILCETGIGAFFDPTLRERFGVTNPAHQLLKNLNSIGIKEEAIDFVILSHLHFDHAGGLLPAWEISQGPAKQLLFPNAKYVVGQEAYQRAVTPHPRDRASFIPELPALLKDSGRLLLVDGSTHPEVFPNSISFFYTHGHTPGHMHTVVKGKTQSITFAGDLIPGTAWVHLPVTMGYDRFAEKVIDEKDAFYKRIADKPNEWVFYTHDHSTALSRISKNEKGRFTALDLVPHPLRWEF